VQVEASTATVGEVGGPFGLVLANIGERSVVELAADLVARIAPGGHMVLAGLLVDQEPRVIEAYEGNGLSHEATTVRDGWASPVFLRKSTTSPS
jgi:ribosomal protein L11 methyltransferase